MSRDSLTGPPVNQMTILWDNATWRASIFLLRRFVCYSAYSGDGDGDGDGDFDFDFDFVSSISSHELLCLMIGYPRIAFDPLAVLCVSLHHPLTALSDADKWGVLEDTVFMASACWWMFCFFLQLLLSLPGGQLVGVLGRKSENARSRLAGTPALDFVHHIPHVASFNLSDGSIVDCVPIELQLSLRHPKLRNHRIQLTPSLSPSPSALLKTETNLSSFQPWQLFHLEHTSCPVGSIPRHRLPRDATEKLNSQRISFSKYPTKHRRDNARNSTQNSRSKLRVEPPAADDSHQYAIVESVGSFAGAQAYLSVWDPSVAVASDFSLSQLWVGAGTQDDVNTVEAGWQVYELLNGDQNPHLFIFWTADAYKSTGCYNLECPGFVQTNSRVVLGGAISTVSSPDSSIFFKKILIYKDPSAWWLQIDNEWVGYWPGTLFTTLKDSAEWLQWGGEVCLSAGSDGDGSTDQSQSITSTEMGSGCFPWEGNSKAASQCELGYVDMGMNVYAATDLKQFSTDPDCYTAASYYDDNWGSYIVFGGSGCQRR